MIDSELAALYAFNAQAVLPLVVCLYVRAKAAQMEGSIGAGLAYAAATIGAGFALLAVVLSFLVLFGLNL